MPDGLQLQNLEGGVFLLRLEPSERRVEWEKDEELISYLKEDGDPYVFARFADGASMFRSMT